MSDSYSFHLCVYTCVKILYLTITEGSFPHATECLNSFDHGVETIILSKVVPEGFGALFFELMSDTLLDLDP